MDLCWSNDSNYLLSGSLDSSAILWSISSNKFNKVQTLEGHKKFVQGVAMHPQLKFISTASSDATVRIFKNRNLKQKVEFYHKNTIKSREDSEIEIPDDQIESNPGEDKKKHHRLFLDDTEYQSFVRRLAWSPDGSFMLTPGSWYQDLTSGNPSEKFQYTVYGFMKNTINKPSFMLPGMKTHANCIRFCPLLLQLKELKEGDPPALIDLPYRMAFAVATIDHVLIYTTQSIYPLAVLKNLHYDSINDLAWVGQHMVMTCSSDGFCSFIKIDMDLIGEPLPLESEVMPEALHEYYKTLSQVSFKANVEAAMQNKSQGFMKVAIKSKRNTEPAPEDVPMNN
jgi:chromatin assembly factor 1 subunit B